MDEKVKTLVSHDILEQKKKLSEQMSCHLLFWRREEKG